MKIIQNFGNVHKDLQELKNEYIQSQMSDGPDDSEDVQLSSQLKQSIDMKEQKVQKMMENFEKIRKGLSQIKVVPQIRPLVDTIALQLDNVSSEELEDTSDVQLSDSLELISKAHEKNQIIQKKLESIMKY